MNSSTASDLLNTLNLLSWSVLAYGWQRSWVTPSDISSFAVACLSTELNDDMLPAVAELASAENLSADEIGRLLVQLSVDPARPRGDDVDIWRLAKLMEIDSQANDWEEKVKKTEELAAEFGYPEDMQGCSRYSSGPSDPIDEIGSLIKRLKNRLSAT